MVLQVYVIEYFGNFVGRVLNTNRNKMYTPKCIVVYPVVERLVHEKEEPMLHDPQSS